ncbi:hypothetical protein CISIN_1g048182mg, partial [Citrus sinensis]
FIQHGAKVIIADVQDDLCRALCKEFDSDELISYVCCNVTSDSDVKNIFDFTKFGKLDIMFNNTGIISSRDRTTLDTDNEKLKRLKLKGVLLFTANLATETIGEALYDYLMSKYAVLGLIKNLCVELGQYGIRVNSIAPIVSATPFFRNAMGIDKKTFEELLYASANLKGVVSKAADVWRR